MTGMGGHEKPIEGETDVWLTPPEIVAALGPFDLDPCSPVDRPWDTATDHLTVVEDGLATPWPDDAFVWMNPPYGRVTGRWLEKLSNHPGGGIALVFARVETANWTEHVWPRATSVLFLANRINFHRPDGTRAAANSGAPSALIAYGDVAAERLRASRIPGFIAWTWEQVSA